MQTNNSLTNKIIENIKSGKTKSKPQLYFLIKTTIYVMLSFVTFIITVYLTSFVAFAIPLGGFSWLLFVLAVSTVLFAFLNIFLAKKFPAFYKRPLLFAFLLFIFLIGTASLLILRTPLHADILEYSKNNYVPVIGHIYKHSCGCEKTCGCVNQCR